jgi:hypothetical protein
VDRSFDDDDDDDDRPTVLQQCANQHQGSVCMTVLFLFQENSKGREVEIDVDELLDMDNDDQRRRHLQVRHEIVL